MSIRYKFRDDHATYFTTFAVVNWIDVFTRDVYRDIVVDSIKYCIRHKGLMVHAWVLMSNHVHLLMSLQQGSHNRLSDIMRDMKKYTAMHLLKAINENPQESRKDWLMYMFGRAGKYNSNNTRYQFWQQDNHPLEIKDDKHYNNTLDYIHNNPVRAGWVENPEEYRWSSAKGYAGKETMIPLAIF